VLENVRIALQRNDGHSFDFWRSEAKLTRHHDKALQLIDAVGLGDSPRRMRVSSPMVASARSRSRPRSRWNRR
jgi:branched-chain amino acid transport system ATP-binding protein